MSTNIRDIAREHSVSRLGLNPFPWYANMRKEHSVHFNEEMGAWEVFAYQPCLDMLKQPGLYSSRRNNSEEAERGLAQSILALDPPRHHQLRALVSQAFTPRAISDLEGRIRQLTNKLLDALPTPERFDLIADLAYPLPVIVISAMLGIPPSERDTFKRLSDDIVGTSKERTRQGVEMDEYFRQVIAQRRQKHGQDLISGLLAARVEGQPLSENEVIDFCILLLVAGNETTTNLIGNAMLCFDEQPAALADLYADHTLIPGALEEVLRYRSPVQRISRISTGESTLGDQFINTGQPIFLWLGAANRDEQTFPEPDTFDIRRTPNKHLAFGNGIHVCLGAPLARLEARLAWECLLDRFPTLRIDRSSPLKPIQNVFGYGVEHLPVVTK